MARWQRVREDRWRAPPRPPARLSRRRARVRGRRGRDRGRRRREGARRGHPRRPGGCRRDPPGGRHAGLRRARAGAARRRRPRGVDPPRRRAVGGGGDGRLRTRQPRARQRSRLDRGRLGAHRRDGMDPALPVAARARLRLSRRPPAVASLAADGHGRHGVRCRHAVAAAATADPRGPGRRRRQPDRRRARPRGPAGARVLGVLVRAAGLAVRRGARAARPLQGGRARVAAPGAVAGLRSGDPAAVAGRDVADQSVRLDRHPGLRGADARARVVRDRGRRGGDAARPLRDRSSVQPHAGLRRADRAAGGDVRARGARRRAAGGRLGVRGVARHARRGARVPPAARPPAVGRRPALRAPALRGRAAAAWLPRRRP